RRKLGSGWCVCAACEWLSLMSNYPRGRALFGVVVSRLARAKVLRSPGHPARWYLRFRLIHIVGRGMSILLGGHLLLPPLEGLLVLVNEKAALHLAVTPAAQLGTGQFPLFGVLPGARGLVPLDVVVFRLEPNGDGLARQGVLLQPHVRQEEAVEDVARLQVK